MIRLQERRIERNKRFFKNQRVSVVRKGEPFRGPLRPRPVTKAFSRRANHQFTPGVLIYQFLNAHPLGNPQDDSIGYGQYLIAYPSALFGITLGVCSRSHAEKKQPIFPSCVLVAYCNIPVDWFFQLSFYIKKLVTI